MTDLDPEDAKLIVLARSARARVGAVEGAAVRDLDGRTYAAAPVMLPSLRLSALQVAVAMAVSSGAPGIEAAVVVGGSDQMDSARNVDAAGVAAVRDLTASSVTVISAAVNGTVLGVERMQSASHQSQTPPTGPPAAPPAGSPSAPSVRASGGDHEVIRRRDGGIEIVLNDADD